MTDWQQLLRASDVAPLTADEVDALRAAIVSEAAHLPTDPPPFASSGLVIGGGLAMAVAAAVLTAGVQRETPPPPTPAVEAPALRQLQFATPGGTRIIWQFDPDFSLRETIP